MLSNGSESSCHPALLVDPFFLVPGGGVGPPWKERPGGPGPSVGVVGVGKGGQGFEGGLSGLGGQGGVCG